MNGRNLLQLTDIHGVGVTLSRHPGNILHLTIRRSSERNHVRITRSDAEHLAAALTSAPAEPATLLEFLDLDKDHVIATREPSGRIRITLRGIADWITYTELADPDTQRLAATLAAEAERPHT